MPTALPGLDDVDPFQQLAVEQAERDDAVKLERARCAHVVQQALEQAATRGLNEQSPVVRILCALKHKIEVG